MSEGDNPQAPFRDRPAEIGTWVCGPKLRRQSLGQRLGVGLNLGAVARVTESWCPPNLGVTESCPESSARGL